MLDNYFTWDGVTFLEDSVSWLLATDSTCRAQTIGDVIVAVLNEAWGGFEMEEPDDLEVIGEVYGNEVVRRVKIFRKAP